MSKAFSNAGHSETPTVAPFLSFYVANGYYIRLTNPTELYVGSSNRDYYYSTCCIIVTVAISDSSLLRSLSDLFFFLHVSSRPADIGGTGGVAIGNINYLDFLPTLRLLVRPQSDQCPHSFQDFLQTQQLLALFLLCRPWCHP